MFKELSFQRVDRRRTCGGDPDFNIILVIFWSLDPLTWFEKKFNFQEWNFREIFLVFARIRPSIEWDPSARLVDGESFVWSKARGVIISRPTATQLRQGQSVAKNIGNLTRQLCPWKSFTHKSHIVKVLVFSEVFKCTFDVFLKITPLETKLFWHFDV